VGGKEQSVLIDRKLEIFQCPVAASKKCFNGSLFDGELLWVEGQDGTRCQTLLIFDVVCWRGDSSIGQSPLHVRLELLRKIFGLEEEVNTPEGAQAAAKTGKIICGGNAFGLSFRPKQCMPLDMLDTLLRHIKHLPYKSDGLVLTPVEEIVQSGTHETMFKLKWHHTVDLEANVATGEVLFGLGGIETANDRVPIETIGLRLCDSFWSDLRASLRPSDPLVGTIVECELHADGSLTFVSVRRDKKHPNSQRTIERTLVNVQEAITPEDLLNEVVVTLRPQITSYEDESSAATSSAQLGTPMGP